MKKMLTLILALMLTMTMLPALAEATGVQQLPAEIAALFDAPAWEGYDVPYTTERPGQLAYVWDEYGDCGLVLMTNGKVDVLCLIERTSTGGMRITGRNYYAIRGDYVPGFDTTPDQPNSSVTLEVYGDDYLLCFSKASGEWRIVSLYDYGASYMAYISSSRIRYIPGKATGSEPRMIFDDAAARNVYGVYDNRFAAFSWHSFPASVSEARAKLSNPPDTPSDFYSPVQVTLRANEQYDVYSAPGRDSYRPANGKAVMSTNDWVQIFGVEDGWALVQYDISSDQMRFGYVDASVLPAGTRVQQLTWYDLPQQTILRDVTVTDDPLESGSSLIRLSAGVQVQVLSSFGQWYYIQTSDLYGRALRGFVPQSCIDLVTWSDGK
ncbi:MAG: hypothetical protein IJE07_03555 [Clostridia bacterium]|nr:hypothetical protein [Clostridia bacterium]